MRAAIKRRPVIAKRKPNVQRYPHTFEREYTRQLKEVVARLKGLIRERLIEKLPQLTAEAYSALPQAARKDAWPQDLAQIIGGILTEFGRFFTKTELEDMALEIGESVSDFNREAIEGQLKRLTGVDVLISEPWLRDKLALFQQTNYELIKTIQEREIGRLNGIVAQGFGAGDRWEDIAAEIGSSFDLLDYEAERLARDQVSKLNGEMTKLRQTELGITKYTWTTAGDERVRDTHAANEGKVFSWDDPPATGHPGEEINCRCVAIPVMESVVEEE